LGVDQVEGLVRGGDVGSDFGVRAEAHGKSFRVKPLLLGYNSPSDGYRHHFSGMDPSASRVGDLPTVRWHNLGFRPARTFR
jgi:hypothetical protein